MPRRLTFVRRLLAPALLAGLSGAAQGQTCAAAWLKTFEPRWLNTPYLGPTTGVYASTLFDEDGPGPGAPVLFVCGDFQEINSEPIAGVARWDGREFTRVGAGIAGVVHGLLVFDDDGTGPHAPALYAIGQFAFLNSPARIDVARWDGAAWSAVGSGLPLILPTSLYSSGGGSNSRLIAFDEDGAGPGAEHLYAIRRDFVPCGCPIGHRYVGAVYRLDGDHWSFVRDTDAPVDAATIDIGGIPSLFLATVDQPPLGAARILRYSGGAWSEFQSQPGAVFGALAAFDDDGAGPLPPALYIGGTFGLGGAPAAPRIARYDGQTLADVPAPPYPVNRLYARDPDLAGPSGTVLYASGHDNRNNIEWAYLWRRDGAVWTTLLPSYPLGGLYDGFFECVTVYDEDGPGARPPALFIGGPLGCQTFPTHVGITKLVADRSSPLGQAVHGTVSSILGISTPQGPQLVVAGDFAAAGSVPAANIARWDGQAWNALGSGLDRDAEALCQFDDGGGPALFAAAQFTTAGGQSFAGVAKWTGAAWQSLGGGMDNRAHALAVYNDGGGPALYAGGRFTTAGGVAAVGIARWRNGAWAPVGAGAGNHIDALAVYDDGDGPRLYAGGKFNWIGGVTTNFIASWDGASWHALPGGLMGAPSTYGDVAAMAVHDDGAGPALFVAGNFVSAAGVTVNSIARYRHGTWTPLGTGLQNVIQLEPWEPPIFVTGAGGALASFDEDGPGPGPAALYVGGAFDVAGGVTTPSFARWNGVSWTGLINPVGGVHRLATFDTDGTGPRPVSLIVGGSGLAELAACRPINCYANCDGGTAPPILNVNDFLCFLNRFAGGDPYANCDHSSALPVLNVQDFTCFLNRFAAGCP